MHGVKEPRGDREAAARCQSPTRSFSTEVRGLDSARYNKIMQQDRPFVSWAGAHRLQPLARWRSSSTPLLPSPPTSAYHRLSHSAVVLPFSAHPRLLLRPLCPCPAIVSLAAPTTGPQSLASLVCSRPPLCTAPSPSLTFRVSTSTRPSTHAPPPTCSASPTHRDSRRRTLVGCLPQSRRAQLTALPAS